MTYPLPNTLSQYTFLTHLLDVSYEHIISTQSQVQPGEAVRFRDYAGADVKLEGKEYRVVRAYDILAKM